LRRSLADLSNRADWEDGTETFLSNSASPGGREFVIADPDEETCGYSEFLRIAVFAVDRSAFPVTLRPAETFFRTPWTERRRASSSIDPPTGCHSIEEGDAGRITRRLHHSRCPGA
jgi:hypothetical protein